MKKSFLKTFTFIVILILSITSCSKKNPGNFVKNSVWYNHRLENDASVWVNMILCFSEDSVFFYLRNDDFTVGEKVGNGVYEIDYEYGNDLPCISFDKITIDKSKADRTIVSNKRFIQEMLKKDPLWFIQDFSQGRETLSKNRMRLNSISMTLHRLENITPYEITHNPDKKKLWESYRQNKYMHSDHKL